MDLNTIIGQNVKLNRELNEMTQVQLAKAVGISTGTLSSIESGKQQPNDSLLDKIAKALSIEKRTLLKSAQSGQDYEMERGSLSANATNDAQVDTTNLLGNNIKRYRKLRGLQGQQLSKMAGITASMLSQIERGNKKPSEDLLPKIAGALQVSVQTLHENQPPKPVTRQSGISNREGEGVVELVNKVSPYIKTLRKAEETIEGNDRETSFDVLVEMAEKYKKLLLLVDENENLKTESMYYKNQLNDLIEKRLKK